MSDLVTNVDDVEVVIEPAQRVINNNDNVPPVIRVVGEEFTITSEQDITSVSGFSKNEPKGLSKGDITHEFDFSVEGENEALMTAISDANGDSNPFSMTCRKIPDKGSDATWEYSYTTCLADSEEITGTTGETLGLSIEGMGAGRDRDMNPGA